MFKSSNKTKQFLMLHFKSSLKASLQDNHIVCIVLWCCKHLFEGANGDPTNKFGSELAYYDQKLLIPVPI